MRTNDTFVLFRTLWEYMRLKEKIRPCDIILGLGSYDENIPIRAAELYKAGFGKKIIFSGGLGRLTEDYFIQTEAEIFRDIAVSLGVPSGDIYIENESSNTGENFHMTDDLIHEENLDVSSILVVTKPAVERRVRAAFDMQMPNYKGIITSPKISFRDYMCYYYSQGFPLESIISITVGDAQRLMVYYYEGYQKFVNIPVWVIEAYNKLCEAGYDYYVV